MPLSNFWLTTYFKYVNFCLKNFSLAGILVIACCLCIHVEKAANFESSAQKLTDSIVIELYHKFGHHQSDFKYRGKIQVKPPTEIKPGFASLSQEELSGDDIAELIKSSEVDGLYYLQAKLVANETSSQSLSQTIAKSCSMLASNLRDFITVNLNHKNEFVSINFHTSNPSCEEIEQVKSNSLKKLETSIQVQSITNGPVPDIATYIKRLQEENQKNLQASKEDNRSFFFKYWMYIVPAVFILMILGSPQEPAAGAR